MFETVKTKPPELEKLISEKLEKAFGASIGVIIRSIDEIRKMADTQPFKNIVVTPQTRRYVTFLPWKIKKQFENSIYLA